MVGASFTHHVCAGLLLPVLPSSGDLLPPKEGWLSLFALVLFILHHVQLHLLCAREASLR
jgi:hypothetical protein